jgi:predicted lipoprotein with Yx(FWY)xxD motif
MKKFSSLRTVVLIGAGAVSAALPASAAPMLTAKNGMTVYVFDKDVGGVPTCYDACARQWPPYFAEGGAKRGARAGPR